MSLIFVWLLIILLFSVIPARGPETDLPLDKGIHFIMYGITAIVFFRMIRLKVSLIKTVILSIIFSSFYGLLMELLQSTLPWREFSLSDELINISGASVFSVIQAVRERREKK
ncbi:MAG: VanZ family protein [Nitrospirota bacterium]